MTTTTTSALPDYRPGGGVLAIRADGHCCYHIATTIGALLHNQDSLRSGWAPCTYENLTITRAQILENFESWVERRRPWCSSAEELEAEHVLPYLGASSEVFRRRVSGEAVGKDRWGTISDLALYTLQLDVLVVVINASAVFPTSSLVEDDVRACSPAHFDLEVPKTRVVCVVLDRDHFSLGVVRTPMGVRAIFQLGPDWDTARHRILEFIKARESPMTPLCPQWTTSPEQSPRAASTDQRPVLSLEKKC